MKIKPHKYIRVDVINALFRRVRSDENKNEYQYLNDKTQFRLTVRTKVENGEVKHEVTSPDFTTWKGDKITPVMYVDYLKENRAYIPKELLPVK